MNNDAFLHDLWDRLHDSPVQRKFKRLAPMPIGVVLIQTPGMTDDDLRNHFRLMKQLGFNCLKGLYVLPGESRMRVEMMAFEEGLIPFYYGEGGYEAVSDEMLSRLGIDPQMPIEQLREHPRYVEYQQNVIRTRISRNAMSPEVPHDGRPRFPFSFDHLIGIESAEHFAQWLCDQYGTVENLSIAWNMNRALIKRPDPMWQTWDDVGKQVIEQVQQTQEYRRLRDVLRYKADVYLGMVQERAAEVVRFDRNGPARAGGEMGLFLPFASRATDMEGVADAMQHAGTFYPSIHLAWHFEEVDFEVARPVYIQASLASDWFKGGWSATWESTGGPQQLSGGKAHLFPDKAGDVAGFNVDGGTMRQLLLSYTAAGFKGVGLWCWNARTAGWEAGEYALLDRQDRPTDRAVEAGKVGMALNRHRDEIWASRKEPLVGVYQDWDCDAMWAVIGIGGRDHFKHYPTFARVGCARSLINGNVPWEFVTATDLRKGLAGRYRVIYLPGVISISNEMLELFREYVSAGGRLVIDLPGGWYDDFGRTLKTSRGSLFEQLFGVTIRDVQYAHPRPRSVEGISVDGFAVDLEVTAAGVLASYDDGSPAVTESRLGAGSAVFIGLEAARGCHRVGNSSLERRLREWALADLKPGFSCDEAIVYRRAAPQADHFFFINEGPPTVARLVTDAAGMYRQVSDAMTGEPVDLKRISVDAHNARWIRCQR
jgi:beta-galactosidase